MKLRFPEGFFDDKPVQKLGTTTGGLLAGGRFELYDVDFHTLFPQRSEKEAQPIVEAFQRDGILIEAALIPLGIPDQHGNASLVWQAVVIVRQSPNGKSRIYRRTISFKFDLAAEPLQPGDLIAEPRDLVPVLAGEFFDALFQSGCCEPVPSPTRLDVLQFI